MGRLCLPEAWKGHRPSRRRPHLVGLAHAHLVREQPAADVPAGLDVSLVHVQLAADAPLHSVPLPRAFEHTRLARVHAPAEELQALERALERRQVLHQCVR